VVSTFVPRCKRKSRNGEASISIEASPIFLSRLVRDSWPALVQ
jgi:hypothetical protein